MPDIILTITDAQSARIISGLRAKYASRPELMALSDINLTKFFITTTLKDMVLTQERSQAENLLLESLDRNF